MLSYRESVNMRICSRMLLRTARERGEREKYYLASQRNGLAEQRGNLLYGLEKLTPPLQAYYLDRIAQLNTHRLQLQERGILCSVGTMTIGIVEKGKY